MATPGLTTAVRDIGFLIWHWNDLVAAKIPGTRRPWAQTMTRAESRRRASRNGDHTVLISKAPAPVQLDALDAAIEIHRIGWDLATKAHQTLRDIPTDLPTAVGDDARPWWQYLARVLDQYLEANPDDLDHVYRHIRHARQLAAATLRLVLDGHVLDADCPWCGSRPLKVRIVADEPVVVCESRRVCEPPEPDCGTWVRDRPAWIQPEWDWLAKRIRHAEEKVS